MARILLMALVVVAAWTMGGCDQDREPIPVHRIVIEANGTFQFDGRRLEHSELLDELARQAELTKRANGPGNRAIIRVVLGQRVPYGNYERLTDELGRLGFKNVEMEP